MAELKEIGLSNISNIHNCYGCGVCALACSKDIIEIRLNEAGFYEPYISDIDKCSHCGLCLRVCSYSDKDLASRQEIINSYAAWSNDERIRRKCSSGGIGFEIGTQLLKKGYNVFACRYNINKGRAEHYIAKTTEDLIQSIGSKYIQSYTIDAFKEINIKQKYLVIGTPCQIDSFRRYIKLFHCENNFVLMDFFCHCVPSMYAWKGYVKMAEKKVGKITYVSWRNKFEYGWHDSWLMGLEGERNSTSINWYDSYTFLMNEKETTISSRWSQGDIFYRLFLGDVCLGPQCQGPCKFKYDNSSADIRIGDLWGKTYEKDEKGVSALVAFTNKGEDVIKNLNNVTINEHPFEVVAEGQMKENAHAKELAPLVMWMLKKQIPLGCSLYNYVLFVQRVINKLKTLF